MRIIKSERGFFWGTHKGADIQIQKEPDGRFYIIVKHSDGGYLYDGWADSSIVTMVQAKREAKRGAML